MNLVVNLQGSSHGWGDVIGSWWFALEMATKTQNNPFAIITVLLDARALDILLMAEGVSSLSVLQATYVTRNLRFRMTPNKQQEQEQDQADYVFEMYSDGRSRQRVSGSVLVRAHCSHYRRGIDEITSCWRAPMQFASIGLGPDRSGILRNPVVDELISMQVASLWWGHDNLSDPVHNPPVNCARKYAIDAFSEHHACQAIEALLRSTTDIAFGFVYGMHNECKFDGLATNTFPQTDAFFRDVVLAHPSRRRHVVFSPTTRAIIEKRLASLVRECRVTVLDPDEVDLIFSMEEDVDDREHAHAHAYVIALPNITNRQFTGLMACSDTCVLVEGDCAVATAVQIGIPFLQYASPWNASQLRQLVRQIPELSAVYDNYNDDGYYDNDNNDDNNNISTPPRFYEYHKIAHGTRRVEALSFYTDSLMVNLDLFYRGIISP